jgi:Leucine-rich repeat (LRR) protein
VVCCVLHICSQALEELRYLPELRTLNIGYNPQLAHLESHIVKGKLPKLQALVCNECGFKSVSFLKFCNNLNTLILSSNSLTVFPTSNDFSMSGLTKLSLSKNNLQQIPNLTVCVNLQELRINNNEISSISDSITIAPKLKILDISNNKIDSWESVEHLLKLQLLTNLSMNGAHNTAQYLVMNQWI